MDWKPITELPPRHLPLGLTQCYQLPATWHRWTRPTLTPAMQAGTRFTYPGGMEGWVDLGVGYIPWWFTCPQTGTYPGTNHFIATQPGVKPTTSRSQVQRPNRYTTKKPILQLLQFVMHHLSHAVRKTVDKVVLDTRNKIQRHLMICFRLATETSDEVTRQRHF